MKYYLSEDEYCNFTIPIYTSFRPEWEVDRVAVIDRICYTRFKLRYYDGPQYGYIEGAETHITWFLLQL
jgi:hypothetical protein